MEETMIVFAKCPFCGKVTEIEVPLIGYLDWEDGELIQNAMPNLSAEQREMLISGMCEECQKTFFGEE